MVMKDGVMLYTVEEDVRCLNCNGRGAIQAYGRYFSNGKKNLDGIKEADKEVLNKPYMSRVVGFGGTIPYRCLNCGKSGLIGYSGLEGYEKAFESIIETDDGTRK
jgi:DNA-directed RNA polymerase subunit N (RpoN/RPB10)